MRDGMPINSVQSWSIFSVFSGFPFPWSLQTPVVIKFLLCKIDDSGALVLRVIICIAISGLLFACLSRGSHNVHLLNTHRSRFALYAFFHLGKTSASTNINFCPGANARSTECQYATTDQQSPVLTRHVGQSLQQPAPSPVLSRHDISLNLR